MPRPVLVIVLAFAGLCVWGAQAVYGVAYRKEFGLSAERPGDSDWSGTRTSFMWRPQGNPTLERLRLRCLAVYVVGIVVGGFLFLRYLL